MQKNTLIIFMADHGNSLGKHDEVSKNHFYEESLRIPFIMHWDGKILARFDEQMLMSEPDIFPTVLNIMGVKAELPADLDGRDFSKYITTGKGDYPKQQYIMGSVTASRTNTGFRGVRTAQYKLVFDLKGKILNKYLFDIQKDPFELNNLYNIEPVVVKTLKKDVKTWLKQTNDNFDIEQ
jgi:arylsulfatase A-like enzyme